jgi:hypothetical protein
MLGADDVGAALAAREPGLDIVLSPEPPLDPVGDPAASAATVRAYGEIGATGLSLRFVHRSRAHYLEQLEAMMGVLSGTGEGR